MFSILMYGKAGNRCLQRVVLPDWRGPVNVIEGKIFRDLTKVELIALFI